MRRLPCGSPPVYELVTEHCAGRCRFAHPIEGTYYCSMAYSQANPDRCGLFSPLEGE